MERFLWQLLNLAPRAPEKEGGAEGEEKQPEALGNEGVEGGDEGEEKQPASRFADKGLARFAKKEGEEEGDDKSDGDKAKTPPPGERPAGLPEKFKSVDALAQAYTDLETKLRNSGKIKPGDEVPVEATVEAYFGEGIELDPEVDRLTLTSDDPGLKVAADVFKKYGIGKATAQSIVKDMFKGMNEHAPLPIDPEQELKALGPNGPAAVEGTLRWLEKLDRDGKLSDDDANFAIDLMATAQGVKFLNKMRSMTGERAIPTGAHIPSSGGMSPEEWHAAYQKAVGDKDYKEQERLDKLSAGVFGTGAASGSPIRGLPEG